ncbi:hypothetical protein QTP88_010339 [Uroleucon formosanum]
MTHFNNIDRKYFRASYLVSLRFLKDGKPHTVGETLILPAAKDIVQIILGEKAAKELGKIPLSNNSRNQPRTQINGTKTGHGIQKTGIKIVTWNTLSLYRTGACQNLTNVLDTYGIQITALQEIRWPGKGQLKVGKYIVYFSGMEEGHAFGCGFAVHESLEPYVKEFNPISERITLLRVDTKPLNIILVCVHALTETGEENMKDAFYEDLSQIYDKLPGNVIKLVIGDLNAKCGKETHYMPMIGKESLHETSNGNALRLISLAAAKDMIISSTTFPHKTIHKATRKSPDGTTCNQIDHILVQKRFRSCIKDIRSFRGADCDSDHFLLVAKFRLKIQSDKSLVNKNSTKINLEMLKDEKVQQKYIKYVGEYVKNVKLNDMDEDWVRTSKAVKEIAMEHIDSPDNTTIRETHYGAEPIINELTEEETYKAIGNLKNWKSPGSDGIPGELIKYGGKEMHYFMFRICQKIWKGEHLPTPWNEAVIIPLHKKGDKTKCENYRGISLLNSAYKVFTKILLNRLTLYVEENLGRYQCGFRKGRSTIERLSVIGQLIENNVKNNDWAREIGVRLVKAERAAFALNKFLQSKVFSKKTKARLYTAIIRPILTYGCEAWTTTSNTERKLRTFENKIWRVICGPVYDNEKGTWRRKYNKERAARRNGNDISSKLYEGTKDSMAGPHVAA